VAFEFRADRRRLPRWAQVLLRVLACTGLAVLAYQPFGAKALVVLSPLFAIALAAPILEVLAQMPVLARWHAFRGFHGRYFAYRGTQVVVHEDAQGYRWVELPAVRRLVPALPGDIRLGRLYPQAVHAGTPPQPTRLRAEELLECLQALPDERAARLRTWLQREVVFPAARARSGPPVP
jgi:hypothetical protein